MKLKLSLISLITVVALVGCGEDSSSNGSSDTSNSTREENSILSQSNQTWIAPKQSTCQNGGGVMNVKGVCLANWENANKICRASGGVLPTIEVLEKVVTDCGGVIDDIYGNSENSDYQACYKREGFVNVDSYWSSTTYTSGSQYALIIYFEDGDESNSIKTFDYDHGVRCARGGENTDIDNSNNSTAINDGLVAYYKFEGNANDSSGNDTHITVSNAIYYTNGKFNKGVGSTDNTGSNQIQILNPLNSKKFTISFWSNPLVNHNKMYGNSNIHVWHSTDTNQRSFSFNMSSGNHSVYLQHEYPELAVTNNESNAKNRFSLYYGENQLAEQEWQHIVFSYDNGMIDVYVNGNKIIQNKRTIVSAVGRNLGISLRGEDKIDDLRIYNRVLNASEIQELFFSDNI